ncbi:MAG: hypothetical protein PHH67_01095 [Methanosarcina sp.]|nr:hypothetical protein [Methanosarcina sp.]MDD3316062.1 hypothetical protein [Methanosarcina sp.]MDD4305103.1 hypothetical protein [Methanosarcina sp.]NLN43500.1 hypothetical protein [Methanosarcina sp.]
MDNVSGFFPLLLDIFKVIPILKQDRRENPTDLEGKRIPIGSGIQPTGKL